MKREQLLEEAKRIVTVDRTAQYGLPEDSFRVIANLWSSYLDRQINSEDVAVMMILLKAARIRSGAGKEDNWVDIAGYAACGAEVEERTRRKETDG